MLETKSVKQKRADLEKTFQAIDVDKMEEVVGGLGMIAQGLLFSAGSFTAGVPGMLALIAIGSKLRKKSFTSPPNATASSDQQDTVEK